MAQLILGLAGQYLAGPPGAIIGSFLGGILDRKVLFPADPILGHRLEDLKVQVSAYGIPITEFWGTMRLAGNVIWATELKETSSSEGGGLFSSSPKVVTYQYFATFAVAICKGPIDSVIRIWADTKIIHDLRLPAFDAIPQEGPSPHPRGERGGFRGPFFQRLPDGIVTIYLGDEVQTADPWIEEVEGAGEVPGFRGLAYVVFKDLPLKDYGNRIPNISFEVARDVDASNPVIDYPDTDFAQNSDFPGIYDVEIHLHPDGRRVIQGTFRINLFTGDVQSFDQLHNGYGDEEMSLDEEGMIYGQSNDDVSSGDRLYKIDFDLLEYVGQGPILTGGAQMALALVVSQNPRMPYLWWGDENGALRVCLRDDLGANSTVFNVLDPGSGENWDVKDIHLDHATGFAWAVFTDTNGSGVMVVRITPDDYGGFRYQQWDVSGTASKGSDSTRILYDPTTDQILIGADNAPSGADPDVNFIWFYDVSSGSPVYSAQLPTSTALILRFYSSWKQGAIGGKLYLAAGAGSSALPYKYIRVDLATQVVDKTWLPADTAADFSHFVWVPRLHAIFADWDYETDHPNFVLILLDRLVSNGLALSTIVTNIAAMVGLQPADIDVSELTDVVVGYVINQRMTARTAVQVLMMAYFFDAVEVDGVIKFPKRGQSSLVTIPESELATHPADSERPQELVTTRQQELELPATVELSYVDPLFEYQMTTQRARRLITQSQEKLLIQLAINLTPDEARQIAFVQLILAWTQRMRHSASIPLKYAYLVPSDVITVQEGGESILVRIDSMDFRGGLIALDLIREDASVYDSSATGAIQAGTNYEGGVGGKDTGPTQFFVMDLPCLESAHNVPGVYVGANGLTDDWVGATIYHTGAFADTWEVLVTTPARAVLGRASTVLGDVADPFVWDGGNTVTVLLLDATTSLSSATKVAVLDGANMAVLGGEIIHFQTVVDNGDDTYTLSGLIRARFGTDDQTGAHAIGDAFMLLESEVVFAETPIEDFGRLIRYLGVTFNHSIDDGSHRSLTVAYRNLKPLSPQHIAGTRNGSNDLTVTWVRRTRIGGMWLDNVDVPLGELIEKYEVDIFDGATLVRTITLLSETTSYLASAQTTDGLTPGDPVVLKVYQISNVVGRGIAASATV